MPLPAVLTRFKPYLRWVVLAATLVFLANALWQHGDEVLSLDIDRTGLSCLAIALGVTLLAHIWSGWVWGWILRALGQPFSSVWSTLIYLQTNIAKYLPGNVWHFFGRVQALQQVGTPLATATLGVLLEPVLMAAAALIVALLAARESGYWPVPVLIAVLVGVHPRLLNPVLFKLAQVRLQDQAFLSDPPPPESGLQQYPIKPLLGELGFVLLRGLGFVLVMQALLPLRLDQLPMLIGGFSLAWLLGLVVPGAPGGLGVFEATALSVLRQSFPGGLVLSGVALYRVISILAEAAGAGLAKLDAATNATNLGFPTKAPQPEPIEPALPGPAKRQDVTQ